MKIVRGDERSSGKEERNKKEKYKDTREEERIERTPLGDVPRLFHLAFL